MTKPTVKLTGEDGNVFIIIGKVSRALKDAGETVKAKEFTEKSFLASSYNEVLKICAEYVEIE